MDNMIVKCQDCELILDELASIPHEKREPCPKCGSLHRITHLQLACGPRVLAGLGGKLRNRNNELIMRLKSFREFFRKLGTWQNTSYVINKRDNKYDKIVTDPDTGKVLYECHEPLSNHTGRGSAKKSKKGGS